MIIVEPSRWLGGMTGGGINHLDWGKGNTVGGSTYRILTEGLKEQKRAHQGHAVLGIGNKEYRERFKKAVEGRDITVIYDHRLGKVDLDDSTIDAPTRRRPIAMNESTAENKEGNSIRSITLDYAPVDETGCPVPEPKKRNAVTISAKAFIDCSYEGDLLAMSGVRYTWGRKSREHYNESLAGVRPSLWVHDIDPYVEPGKPESGLIPFVQDRKLGPEGSADSLTMGYCFRFEFDMSGKGIPIPEPPHAIGLAAYGVDDWPYATVVEDGKVALQGGEFSILYLDNGKYNGSYKIPYEAIVPRKGECDNLLVPVRLSASHIAMTSIRMEPVWMILGESAGVAAAMAVDADIPVQDVPYNKLRKKLEDLDQILDRKTHSKSALWKSQDEWNKQKKGWEWLFPHIDTNSDGQISVEEYNAFQKFKAEHDDWEELLRNDGYATGHFGKWQMSLRCKNVRGIVPPKCLL